MNRRAGSNKWLQLTREVQTWPWWRIIRSGWKGKILLIIQTQSLVSELWQVTEVWMRTLQYTLSRPCDIETVFLKIHLWHLCIYFCLSKWLLISALNLFKWADFIMYVFTNLYFLVSWKLLQSSLWFNPGCSRESFTVHCRLGKSLFPGSTDHLGVLIPYQSLEWLAYTGKPQDKPEISSLLDGYWSRIETLKDSITIFIKYVMHISHKTLPLICIPQPPYLKYEFIKSISTNTIATFDWFVYLST